MNIANDPFFLVLGIIVIVLGSWILFGFAVEAIRKAIENNAKALLAEKAMSKLMLNTMYGIKSEARVMDVNSLYPATPIHDLDTDREIRIAVAALAMTIVEHRQLYIVDPYTKTHRKVSLEEVNNTYQKWLKKNG